MVNLLPCIRSWPLPVTLVMLKNGLLCVVSYLMHYNICTMKHNVYTMTSRVPMFYWLIARSPASLGNLVWCSLISTKPLQPVMESNTIYHLPRRLHYTHYPHKAPENIEGTLKRTCASDIFTAGKIFKKIAKRMDHIAMGELSNRPHSTASLCCSEDFKSRGPSAIFLVDHFKNLKDQITL